VEHLKGRYDQNIVIGYKQEEFGIAIGHDFYPLKFFLDEGNGLVGVFGNYSELRLKPPLWGENGSLVHLNRFSGTCTSEQILSDLHLLGFPQTRENAGPARS
jgi:hypothetical protein